MSAPTRSDRRLISFIKLIRVANIAFEAYLMSSALAMDTCKIRAGSGTKAAYSSSNRA